MRLPNNECLTGVAQKPNSTSANMEGQLRDVNVSAVRVEAIEGQGGQARKEFRRLQEAKGNGKEGETCILLFCDSLTMNE